MPSSQWAHKRYFTGEPCQYGHIAERRICDDGCVECVRQRHLRRGGGTWTKQKPEVRKRYDQSEKGKAHHARYRKTAKRRASAIRYNKTAKGKASRRRVNQSENYKAYRSVWNATEKGRAGAIRNSHIRRARKKGAGAIQYTFAERQAKFAEFDNCCAYCGHKGPLSEDHVVALARRGPHAIENMVPCCLSCNKKKNAQDVNVWYPKQPFFTEERWQPIKEAIEWVSQKI